MARTVNMQQREERRKQILNAGTHLFSLYGYSETSMAMVASEIGMSSGTIFQYFASKEDLFRNCVLEPLTHTVNDLMDVLHQEQQAMERLQKLIQLWMEKFDGLGTTLRLVQYVIGQQTRFPELTQEIKATITLFTDELEIAIRDGQRQGVLETAKPGVVADAFLAYMNGVFLTFVHTSHYPEWESIVKHGISLLLPKK